MSSVRQAVGVTVVRSYSSSSKPFCRPKPKEIPFQRPSSVRLVCLFSSKPLPMATPGLPLLSLANTPLLCLPTFASEKHDINQSREDFHSKQTVEHNIDKSWKDLLLNHNKWWDVRSSKENPKGAAFERKMNGELLFINSSTPKWLQEKLESMTIDLKPELKNSISGAKKGQDSSLSYWRDLLDDPKQWSDFRDSKLNGLVNSKFPDLKRKDSSVSLWLDRAPKWVLSELEGLKFDVPVVKSKQAKDGKGDQSWNDLLKNPDKWWDNRSNKRNERYPDFKHKETGEGLWLKGSPSWVLPKLPPLKAKQSVEIGGKQTLVS